MFKKISLVFLLPLIISGCTSIDDLKKSTGIGERDIRYYSNKSTSSLEVPPDLTKPIYQNTFALSEFGIDNKKNLVRFDKKTASKILKTPTNIKVKRSGDRRWLIVDKPPAEAWVLSQDFLRHHGFAITKSNKNIGIIETDYLESRPKVSDQSLGVIRAALRKIAKLRYTLPVADKYRIRIEPLANGAKSEVYLTLTSVREVITGKGGDEENTVWQTQPKDQSLEVEMLYRLMVFLGADEQISKHKITSAKESKSIKVRLSRSISGYARLNFELNKVDAWRAVGWALDELNIDIEDKDLIEGSFYIKAVSDKEIGILSRIFGTAAIQKSFQILVRTVGDNKTEVSFNDLTEKHKSKTIDFSFEFLRKIQEQFL